MKELYTKPELKLDKFYAVDVLTASTDELDAYGNEYADGDDD